MFDKDIIENLSFWLNSRNQTYAAYYLGKLQGKGLGIANWIEDAVLACENKLNVPDTKLAEISQALQLMKEGHYVRKYSVDQN
jgi:hypothetical protein